NASFADKNAGTNKTVSVSGVEVVGADAGNYVLNTHGGSTTADIAARTLNVSFSGINKTYDGNTSAGVNIGDDRVAGDALSLSGNAAFGDKNVGTGKTVSVTNIGVTGADAGNYVLGSHGGSTTADIAARTLNVSFSGINKTYDGNTSAGVNIGDDRVAGDALSLSGNASFADKNAGTNKTVSVSGVEVVGADAGNYVLNTHSGSTTADIVARTLNVSFSGINKTYDGNTSAGVQIGDDRVAGDSLNLSGNASFADKNAGTNKTVSVSDVGVTGADAGNYVLSSHRGSTTADIAARTLNVSFSGINKTYDGTTSAGVNIGDDRVAGDSLTLAGNASFADKNAGTGKTVSVTNVGVSGTDAGNYVLSSHGGSTTADIAARTLNVSFSGINKTYDGNTSAGVNIGDDRVAGDALTLSGNAAFGDKNAGTSKTVSVTNIGVTGADAGNYVLSSHGGSTTADIAARTLNVSFSGINKTYDGTASAGVNIGDDRVAGDALTLSGHAAFGDKNAGTGKTVSVTNVGVVGADAGNYVLNTHGGSTTADIAARALNLSATGVSKVYDGGTAASVVLGDDRIAGDVLGVTAGASFADKNVGANKAVSLTGVALSGQDAGNYLVVLPTGLLASITPAALNLTGLIAGNKVYDGTTNAAVSASLSGVLGQDLVSVSGGSGSFADKNAGADKLVTATGFRLAGADAGNYVLSTTGGITHATISQKLLSTWIGSGNGLWSDAANWDGGVVPEGANVLAVDFSHSNGIVTYNAAAGSTTLKNLNLATGLVLTGGSLSLGEGAQDRSVIGGSDGLTISGGNLQLNGSLSADRYVQSGGLLGGGGNLAIGNSFSQTAGAINLGGQLFINQASGDLRFASLAASDVRLSALNGAIRQTGAIVASSLSTQSSNGTVLDNAGNQVSNFTASNSGAGGIVLNNTSAPGTLTLGAISSSAGNIAIDNTGGISAGNINGNGGNVALTSHSPVTLNGVVNGNDISITADTDIALADGARLNAARNVSLAAGRDISFDGAATVASGGSFAASAGASVRFAGNASFTVPGASSMSVLARTGSITGTTGVRINRQRSDVSLLAPGGTVSMPDAIFLPGTVPPVTVPPVIPPSVNTAINDALNIIKQGDHANTPLLPTVTSTAAPDKKKDDVKEVATSDQSTGNKFNDGTKKMYCN
uniref:beta strand repeat-containing protein n=1 Tax=Janthinobacterium sp. TaxID=1871054 RepID=UPI0026098F7D